VNGPNGGQNSKLKMMWSGISGHALVASLIMTHFSRENFNFFVEEKFSMGNSFYPKIKHDSENNPKEKCSK